MRRTCNPKQIIIVYDGAQAIEEIPGTLRRQTPWVTPQGVGRCRDWGIQFAESEYIILLDGHMDFGPDWADVLVDTCKQNKDSIVCSRSASITTTGMRASKRMLSGAHIRYIGAGGMPLEVEWGESCEPGEIQCCLGACYCMKTSRYFAIGEPCAGAFGRGTSEQTLCMVNEFCGGVNILADCTTGHIYRDKTAIPYEFGTDHKIGRMFNRLRLIDMLPMPGDEKVRLLNKTMGFRSLRLYAARAFDLLQITNDRNITDRFTITWEDYTAKWWPKTEDRTQRAPHAPQQDNSTTTDERFI